MVGLGMPVGIVIMGPQRVLVTGASGFIGRRLVRRLSARQCRVSCLVRTTSRLEALRSAGAHLVMGDVTDRGSVERALAESEADTVFHLAGLVKAVRRNDFTRANSDGVANVAGACAARPGPPVLIVVSSLSAAGPCRADTPRVEDDPPAPVSHYGRSKLAGELAATAYADVAPITVVRPPIVFGPGDRGALELYRPIARWGVHLVPGRGERRFSLVHVDDLVEGLLLAAERGERLAAHAAPGQGVYFIGGDDHPTFGQLGGAIALALGRAPPTVLHLPGLLLKLIGTGGDLSAQVRRHAGWISSDKFADALAGSWVCSPAKAHAQLGWSPAAALADRLHETAQWYRAAGWL